MLSTGDGTSLAKSRLAFPIPQTGPKFNSSGLKGRISAFTSDRAVLRLGTTGYYRFSVLRTPADL